MFVMAHAGITLGAAMLMDGAAAARYPKITEEGKATENTRLSLPALAAKKASERLTSLYKRGVDIRLLLFASLLPDIIDKPLGQLILRDSLSSGRTLAHTLLFTIVLALAGLFIYKKYRQIWMLVISFGVLMHIVLDGMWRTPKTLLWPLFGFQFPQEDLAGWASNVLLGLVKNPAAYIPELIGAFIIAWFFWLLLRRKKIMPFVKHSQIS